MLFLLSYKQGGKGKKGIASNRSGSITTREDFSTVTKVNKDTPTKDSAVLYSESEKEKERVSNATQRNVTPIHGTRHRWWNDDVELVNVIVIEYHFDDSVEKTTAITFRSQ